MASVVDIPPRNRIEALTSLRFFLAFWIFAHHLYPSWFTKLGSYICGYTESLFMLGYMAVPFFFILSGFSIYYGYNTVSIANKTDTINFYLRRLSRLVPFFYISMIVGAVPYFGYRLKFESLTSHMIVGAVRHFLRNTLFITSYASDALRYNYSGWSVIVEVFLYLCFPLLSYFLLKMKSKQIYVVAVGLYLLQTVFNIFICHKNPELLQFRSNTYIFHFSSAAAEYWRYGLLYHPLAHFHEFLLGIALAHFTMIHVKSTKMIAMTDSLLALNILAFAVLFYFSPQIPYPYMFSWAGIPLMLTMIYAIAYGEGRICNFLRKPLLVRLGESSYVFYILHTPARNWMSFFMGRMHIRGAVGEVVVGLLFIPAYIFVCLWLQEKFERKMRENLYHFLLRFLPKKASTAIYPNVGEVRIQA